MSIKEVQLGGSFRLTWISSGAVASPISGIVYTGSETVVNTYSGVSSGNGHYYIDAAIPSSYPAGNYRFQWIAVVLSNTYIENVFLTAAKNEVGQAGNYLDWDHVVARYGEFSTYGATLATSHYITMAEAELESRLGVKFTVPFSSNNLTAIDIATDMAFIKAARLKGKERQELQKIIDDRIKALIEGDAVMIAGGTVVQQDVQQAWSTDMDYHPVFSLLDLEDSPVSSQYLIEQGAERGFNIG